MSYEPLEFRSLLDLVAIETGRPVEDLLQGREETVDSVAEEFARTPLSAVPLILASPVRAPTGKADLMAVGADLSKRFASLLKRQFQDPENRIGPVCLEPAPELLSHFRKKVTDRLRSAQERAQGGDGSLYAHLYRSLPPEDRKLASQVIDEVLQGVLGRTSGITTLLDALRLPGSDAALGRACEAAFAAMAIFGAFAGAQESGGRRQEWTRVAGAALFMDLAVMVTPSVYADDTARHPERSAQMAEDLGLEAAVVAAIASHHRTEDAQGRPILRGQVELSPYARVLVVTNLFLGSLSGKEARAKDIETIKALNYLAGEGYVDPKAVQALTKLYFSKRFAVFMEHAGLIREDCVHQDTDTAILWSVLGERMPYKFICRRVECERVGSQATKISSTLPIAVEGRVVAKIRAGNYLSCKPLSDRLERLLSDLDALRV